MLVSTDNPLPGSISDKISLGDEMDASVMDIVTNAKIILEKGSNIKAGGSVVMKAVSSQKNNLVPFVEGANIINVKIGNAVISIFGNIEAGGAVEATASSTVNVAASNETLAKYYIPLAAGILVSEARVETGKDEVITAGGDVKLSLTSDVTLTTLSTVGALPISLALSVVVNDSHVQVLGKDHFRKWKYRSGCKRQFNSDYKVDEQDTRDLRQCGKSEKRQQYSYRKWQPFQ